MRYSKGVSWIDDVRIPFVDENTSRKQTPVKVEVYGWANHKGQIGSFDDTWKQGRFPANLLVSDDMLNDGSVSKTGDIKPYISKDDGMFGYMKNKLHINSFNGDKGTNSRYYDIDKWFNNLIDV
jgi:hypothetical protein